MLRPPQPDAAATSYPPCCSHVWCLAVGVVLASFWVVETAWRDEERRLVSPPPPPLLRGTRRTALPADEQGRPPLVCTNAMAHSTNSSEMFSSICEHGAIPQRHQLVDATGCVCRSNWKSPLLRSVRHAQLSGLHRMESTVVGSMPMLIPRQIYQTGPPDPSTWGAAFNAAAGKWADRHRTWGYHFWNDSRTEESHENPNTAAFVRKHFPFFLPTWHKLCYRIHRFDVARYMWLYVYGGVYVDLDIEPLRSLEGALHGAELVLPGKDLRHSSDKCPPTAEPLRGCAASKTWPSCGAHVGNYLMASVPRHPLWIVMLRYIADHVDDMCARCSSAKCYRQMKQKNSCGARLRSLTITELTGPWGLGRALLAYLHASNASQHRLRLLHPKILLDGWSSQATQKDTLPIDKEHPLTAMHESAIWQNVKHDSLDGSKVTQSVIESGIEIVVSSGRFPSHPLLLVFVPFALKQAASVGSMLRSWQQLPPCDRIHGAQPCADLALVTSLATDNDKAAIRQRVRAMARDSPVRRCFHEILLCVTDLPKELDVYKYASTHVFYWVMTAKALRARKHTHLLQIELDVVPVRRMWLQLMFDALMRQRGQRPFWMLGAHTFARNCSHKHSRNLNGNAVYNYSSSQFVEFMLRMKADFGFGKPAQAQAYYDVAFERYVRWRNLSKEASLFFDTPLIRNCPLEETPLSELPAEVLLAHHKRAAALRSPNHPVSITPFAAGHASKVTRHVERIGYAKQLLSKHIHGLPESDYV
jgi:hypothetical protein